MLVSLEGWNDSIHIAFVVVVFNHINTSFLVCGSITTRLTLNTGGGRSDLLTFLSCCMPSWLVVLSHILGVSGGCCYLAGLHHPSQTVDLQHYLPLKKCSKLFFVFKLPGYSVWLDVLAFKRHGWNNAKRISSLNIRFMEYLIVICLHFFYWYCLHFLCTHTNWTAMILSLYI